MPIGGSQTESQKKRSPKKKRAKRKSKQRIAEKIETQHPIKNTLNSNQYDFNKLTPANISSLRWDNTSTDPTIENNRIENYKELRRQRYGEARQQAIQTLVEKMTITNLNVSKK